MNDRRKREIRREADSFRAKCNISRYGITDLFRDCDRLGYKLLRYPLGENADLGMAMKRDHDIIIFTKTSSRLSREIFTLAHEIGHAVLHIDSLTPFIDNQATLSGSGKDEREKEANYFAACLLMPDDEVDRFIDRELSGIEKNGFSALDIARIMSEFSVSFEIAINRLEDLQKIDENQKTRLATERAEKRVGNLLRSIGGNARLNTAEEEIALPPEFVEYALYNFNCSAIPKETLEKVLDFYHLSMDDVTDKLIPQGKPDEDLDALIGGLDE